MGFAFGNCRNAKLLDLNNGKQKQIIKNNARWEWEWEACYACI
jgi:hypothetical protein